ncbi:MAG: DUF115 domain-containing protein [Desulfobacula sp.]|nr:DUF115 domain-containing protein [Desulfobacula sp.]
MAALDKIHFKKNIALLKKNHPDVFKIISSPSTQSNETELVKAKNKKLNLKIKISENEYVLVHDPNNPGSEAVNFLSMVDKDSTAVVMMFGMGLGYSVLELIKKRKKMQHLIIFELNINCFRLAIEKMDLTQLFGDSRVIISLGQPADLLSVLSPANRSFMLENTHTLSLQTCFKADPGYEKLSSKVFDYINAFNTEGATKTLFGQTFIENRLTHLTSIHHDRKLEELAGMFEGVPAMIVAAGPSLDTNIDQLVKAKGKAVIICVDTALPSLLEHGIVPDFITSIDYNELTYEKIANSAANKACRQINLICTSWVTHRVPKIFPAKNIFWAFGINALETWINTSLGGKVAFGGAGTVAHLNFISAQTMGCDPIIFVGQDLAFSHSKGHSSKVVLTSNENIQKMIDDGHDIMQVDGVVEPKVLTNRQMHGYRRGFEKMIKGSGKQVINSTQGGALIEGAQNMPLARAVEKFCKAGVTLDILKARSRNKTPLPALKSTLKEIKKLEKIIKKADTLADSVKKKLGKQKKNCQKLETFNDLPEKMKRGLAELDDCNNKSDKSSLWPLFDEMTMDGLRENEREKREIEQLQGIPGKFFEWLVKSVNRIDNVNKIRVKNLKNFKKQLNEIVSYYKSEKIHLERIFENQNNLKTIHKLAAFYFESENFVQLEKLLDQYVPDIEESADIHYYYGIIALLRTDYDTAESRFESALNLDQSFITRINNKRKEIADYYYNQATDESTLTGFGDAIVEMLYLKGLKCCPGHEIIKNRFEQFAVSDLKKLEQNTDPDKKMLKKWTNLIYNESQILGCMTKDAINKFYLSYGKILIDEKNFQEALGNYQKGLSVLPVNPDFHIALADIYFSMKDFPSGIQYLKTAVNLDNRYAVYWYNMGKNLQVQKDYNAAILAFEQYFIAKPENNAVLKDIGDCHTKLGNIDAASEAYQQFEKLESKK